MAMMNPPLKPLHSKLDQSKLNTFAKVDTDKLKHSLDPGHEDGLKTRPDGTMLDGHHRIHVLQSRGVNVDNLPRRITHKSWTS